MKKLQDNNEKILAGGQIAKVVRGGMQVAGGLVPFAGGLLSAAAGAWSENEQKKVNCFFKDWVKMLEDEIREKEKTILEIVARLDIHDEEIAKRMRSSEYQSLLKKTFREWAGAESEEKRQYIRNILSNAAATALASDDVVRLFIDWLKNYSEMHFHVIGAIYNSGGISRGEIWEKIGKDSVREDSADADLYKLLFRDLSTGGIIRQHKEKTWDGRFLKQPPQKRQNGYTASREMKSAFDREEKYELTDLGQQFVHYAMTDLPLKIDYKHEEKKI
ncbi:MAG: hypothetical protein Q7S77_00695 [Candidatus Staskawiczbacteria bacterium]|nr:hypothetical protein [Candidatus Staskawiczbacteria bacterium]